MLRIGWRPGAGAVVLALVAALAVPVALDSGAGAAPRGAARGGAPAGPLRWVTLITGDRVALRPGAGAAGDLVVQPAAGREKVRFLRFRDRRDTVVVPADVAALVSAGRLDRRLFNVTKLLRFGFDDRSRPDLPLIVSHAGGAAGAPAARSRLATAGARAGRELPSIGAAVVRAEKAAAGRFWATVRADLGAGGTAPRAAGGVTRVWLDGPVQATLDQSVPQVGAPAAWQAGFTGAGSTVAVLDTGLDASHPDLAGAVAGAADFTEEDAPGTDDEVGHGTHVASIVTGSGAASGGRYAGVAPDAKLLVGKVLGEFGGVDSWIIAGMEWAAAQHARVVNMSLGSPFPADGLDPVEQALDRLTGAAGGPLFVVAAGNDGPFDETIGSPAEVDSALTVGAVDKQDGLAEFSSRGPARSDAVVKPDLTAPGVGIVAAKAEHAQIGEPVGESYLRLSGTSMATPHVAGAAAILAGQHPDWTAAQLKAALVGSAAPRAGVPVDAQGAGRLDVARAVSQPAYATPANLGLGIARWPHADDPVSQRTVTYHNAGAAPLTLDLDVAMTDPAGQAAPAGMFTLGSARLTVPAGGTAGVQLTAVTTGAASDGRYTGVLTATAAGGSTSIRTPVSLVKEVESYDVPVRILDRTGKPTANYGFRFVDIDRPKAYLPYDPSGTVVARLPKGHYYFEAFVQTQIGPGEFDLDITSVFEPHLAVSGAAPVVVDARRGKPVGLTVDRPARPNLTLLDATLRTNWGVTGLLAIGLGGGFEDMFVRPSATAAPPGRFTFTVAATLARPDPTGGFDRSPYVYLAGWRQPDRVPSDLLRRLPDRGMTALPARIAAPTAGRAGLVSGVATLPLPGSVTYLVSRGVGGWFRDVVQLSAAGDFETFQVGAPRRLPAGPATAERWNAPVFGPAFPDSGDLFAGRLGNEVAASLPLFSDQVPDHQGFSATDSGRTRLFRDGQLAGEEPFEGFIDVQVPAEPATYRLETEANRSGVSPLSTRVSAVWTFRSGNVPGPEPAAFPLAAVRFAPGVDELGRPPAGRLLPVPVYVQRQAGGGFGRVASLRVQVSFDDGASWAPVTLAGSGDRRVAMIRQPAGPGFVSLRASAGDRAGNSVQETIIRAYPLR